MNIPQSHAMPRKLDVMMTPMIDVVFLLLIFFVCTASFQIAESILPSPLSTAQTSELEMQRELQEVELEHVLIEVTRRDNRLQLTVNSQSCASLQELSALLSALSVIDRTLPVILDIAGETPLVSVIDVYDRCRLAGFEQIQFAAQQTP